MPTTWRGPTEFVAPVMFSATLTIRPTSRVLTSAASIDGHGLSPSMARSARAACARLERRTRGALPCRSRSFPSASVTLPRWRVHERGRCSAGRGWREAAARKPLPPETGMSPGGRLLLVNRPAENGERKRAVEGPRGISGPLELVVFGW